MKFPSSDQRGLPAQPSSPVRDPFIFGSRLCLILGAVTKSRERSPLRGLKCHPSAIRREFVLIDAAFGALPPTLREILKPPCSDQRLHK
jgi:hypothetical protein